MEISLYIYIYIGSRKNSPWSHGRSDRKPNGIPCPRSRFFVIFAMKVFFLGVLQKPPSLLLLSVQLRHPPTFFFRFFWVLNLIGIQTLAHKTLYKLKGNRDACWGVEGFHFLIGGGDGE